MLPLGEWMELEAVRRFDFGTVFRDPDGDDEALLPASKVPQRLKLGDKMNLFVHLDSHQRPVLTDEEPPMILGGVAALKIKDIRDQGAFLEWLSDRDLFLPHAELPRIVKAGQRIWIQLQLDPLTDRLVGASRLDKNFPDTDENFHLNQEVNLKVFRRTDIGYQCLINDTVIGVLMFQDVFTQFDWNLEQVGYIKEIRADGKLDVALRPQGFLHVIDEDRETILKALESHRGFLPLHDKSDAELIRQHLRMSKKAFKKAVGNLWKDGLIELKIDGIKLI